MRRVLTKIFKALNSDLTGRSWTRQTGHPYFGIMTYFGSTDPARCYWEAELSHADLAKKFSVTLQGTTEGPLPAETDFCRSITADLDSLFSRCREAFEAQFSRWPDREIPADFGAAFILDGLSIPHQGNPLGAWDVTYFADPVGHYFTAQFRDNRVVGVTVDG
jgi:hypothetical protein